MKTILLSLVLFALVGFLVADGVEMYKAHREAVRQAEAVAQQAAQVFLATNGSENASERVAQAVAAEAGVELLDLSYHRGTTRWVEATVRAESESRFLRRLPFLRDFLDWEATAVVHF